MPPITLAVLLLLPTIGTLFGVVYAAHSIGAARRSSALPKDFNVFALLSLPMAFFLPPLGAAFSLVGLLQVWRTNKNGLHLALSGMCMSLSGLWAIAVLILLQVLPIT